jgi:AraC-like DNA-binding protein
MAINDRVEAIPPPSLFLSTAEVPARDRLAVWREVFGRTMVHLDIEPAKGATFHAEGELCALSDASLASVTVSPVRVSRTQRLIDDAMAETVFLITADVPILVSQGGREEVLAGGDAVFVLGGEQSVIQWHERARFTNISVPIHGLREKLPACEDISMTVVRRQSETLDLLLGYAGLLQDRRKPLSHGLGHLAAGHIRDLMAAMAATAQDHGQAAYERRGVRAGRLRAIKADIGRFLCDPGLSIDRIAAGHRISSRYIRKLFQEEGMTFSDFVLHLRLERARKLLLSREGSSSTIASIAHACGFGDQSYFNRTFRRSYGITPSDFRGGGC